MLPAVTEIITASVYIVQAVPIGTNLGLCRILWALVNGSLLISRGAIHGRNPRKLVGDATRVVGDQRTVEGMARIRSP